MLGFFECDPTSLKQKFNVEGQREGESFRAFQRRLKEETRKALLEETRKGLKVSEKRKR